MGTQTRFQISNFSRRKRNLRRKKSEEREFENTLARADFAYHPFPFFHHTEFVENVVFCFQQFQSSRSFFAVLGSRKLSTLPCISTGERMLPTFSCRIPFFINLSFLSFFCFSLQTHLILLSIHLRCQKK